LRSCGISDEGCADLSSALRSHPSHLRELDLSENYFRDSGVKQLSQILEDPQCKLEKLVSFIHYSAAVWLFYKKLEGKTVSTPISQQK